MLFNFVHQSLLCCEKLPHPDNGNLRFMSRAAAEDLDVKTNKRHRGEDEAAAVKGFTLRTESKSIVTSKSVHVFI